MNADAPSSCQPPESARSAPALAACCRASAGRYLRQHRDVATCDTCSMLLLAYGNDRDFDETRKALTEQRVTFATDRQGELWVVAKARAVQSSHRKPR